jgi:hypothetical protein
MNLTLDPKLEAALDEEAQRQGLGPETLALNALREKFIPRQPIEARDDWERRVLAAGSDCGVSIPASALTRDELYD